MKLKTKGFTIIELMVSLTVGTLILIVFLSAATTYFNTISRSSAFNQMTVASQNLLRTTVENIRFGDGVLLSNLINDPNAPTGGWNTSNTNFVIILAVPAVDSSKNYIIDPNTGSPYMNELVYYKSGSNLMERKLANPNATGDTLITTCPASLATNTCPADTNIASYFSSMSFTLYDINGSVTASTSAARSIGITLVMSQFGNVHPLTYTNSIRVTLRNEF